MGSIFFKKYGMDILEFSIQWKKLKQRRVIVYFQKKEPHPIPILTPASAQHRSAIWRMQEWESVCWGAGGFLVSGSLGFLVSWFLVSWFLGLLDSKNHQMSIACFLEDIDPISKSFKKTIKRIFGTFRCPPFPNLTTFGSSTMLWFIKNNILKRCPCLCFLFFVGVLVSHKNNIGFKARDTSQNPEIIEMRGVGFSHKQIEKLWNQNEAE